jgi:hypothetical protein
MDLFSTASKYSWGPILPNFSVNRSARALFPLKSGWSVKFPADLYLEGLARKYSGSKHVRPKELSVTLIYKKKKKNIFFSHKC